MKSSSKIVILRKGKLEEQWRKRSSEETTLGCPSSTSNNGDEGLDQSEGIVE